MEQKDRDRIWDRGNAADIMHLARQQFREAMQNDLQTEAHTALASTHYSLVKRYKRTDPRALWHAFAAAMHARDAVGFRLKTFDQADVCANILSKVPRLLGGSLKKARRIAKSALEHSPASESEEMVPHTRALLLCTLADIEYRMGEHGVVASYYDEALALKDEILHETDITMAQRQWVRIAFAAGSWNFNCGDRAKGARYVGQAYALARHVSKDQLEEKILPWMKANDMAA